MFALSSHGFFRLRCCLVASLLMTLGAERESISQTPSIVSSSAPREIILKVRASTSLQKKSEGTIAFDSASQLHVRLRALGNYRALAALPESGNAEINRFVLLRFDDADVDMTTALASLSDSPEIEYAQFNHVLRCDGFTPANNTPADAPNDSLYSQQWALQTLRAPEAWQITSGAPEVLIAVIDTGVELDHPDLQANLWINAGEDLNGNGRAEQADFNNIDDDGNGFIDDIIGWDFTDAPGFPDAGDHLDRDNDPSDDNGHGTAVSGIIAAQANNRIGIAGLAPQCRVMALRAGTSQGLLEEDDVASAIVYAVMNGAAVINMSFGDVVVSPMLRDVIQFAHRRGVVLVASAGNSSTDAPHYPSAYAETIAVGASTPDERLAAFSNYGTTLDVVAPGTEIWTTTLRKSYAQFGGTSAAAPFVSALAGLLRSRSPEWNNEMIRAALQNSAVDLGEPGWDRSFGAGRIDAAAALALEQLVRCEIHAPEMDAGFDGSASLVIRGTVLGAFLKEYELSFGAGDNPAEWQVIASGLTRQALDDSLGRWKVQALPDGIYTLRLVAHQQNGQTHEDKIRIFLDHTPPQIDHIKTTPMIDGNRHSVLIEFATDDLSRATLWWRARHANASFAPLALNYLTDAHRLNFSQTLATGEIEFYLETVNRAGLQTINDNHGQYFLFRLDQPEIASFSFVEIPFTPAAQIPAGLLLPRATDFDADGNAELLLSVYDQNNAIGLLTIFEHNREGFTPQFSSSRPLIPRDVGDSDGDGKLELLAGIGPKSFIYEAPEIGAFPTQLVWADSNEFWASRFADLDGDNRVEIVARDDAEFMLWEHRGNHVYDLIFTFENFTAGSNFVGVPHSEIGDFDGDGQPEILFGDADGDLYIYETVDNNMFAAIWSDSLPLVDSIDFIRAGDFDGDGRMDFAAGCHSSPELNAEHEFDTRHWLFRIYRSNGDNRYDVMWEQRFFGFQPPQDFDAGLGAGDVDGDGRDELFLNLFPDGYVVDYDEAEASMRVIWHYAPVRSNTTVVTNLRQSQANAFCFSDGTGVRVFQPLGAQTGAPPPGNIEARPQDAANVQLQWQPVAEAEGYVVYRGKVGSEDDFTAIVNSAEYLDTDLTVEQAYRYAVATIDSQRVQIVGPRSREVIARPSLPPRVLHATFFAPQQVAVTFSEPMHETIRVNGRFCVRRVSDDSLSCRTPESLVLSRSNSEVILTFAKEILTPGDYEIEVTNAFDADRVALDSLYVRARFGVTEAAPRFYLSSARLESPKSVLLTFNLPVDPVGAGVLENYSIRIQNETALQPTLKSAEALGDDATSVRLLLGEGYIAATGLNYLITVHGVRSASGIPLITGEGDAAGFASAAASLDEVKVFPNPFIASRHERLTISGLTPAATIKILDLQGRVLMTFTETDGNGGYAWDARDPERNLLPSGVYVCYVRSGSQTTWVKFVVVR